MEVFFVRHGETAGNLTQRHQTNDTELTDSGRKQAQAVSEQLLILSPTHLISSPLTRAVQTAEVISNKCQVPSETNWLFAEISRPDAFGNRHRKGLYSIWFYLRWFFEFKSSEIAGSESYSSLRQRIVLAQKMLASYPEDSKVVVVSHTVFINFFIAHLCRAHKLTFFEVLGCVRNILKLPNVAIIEINYDVHAKGSSWFMEN